MEIEKHEELLKEFKNSLLNNDLKKAEGLKKQLTLSDAELQEFISKSTISPLKIKKKFKQAVEIAKKFEFSKIDIEELVFMEFKNLFKKRLYIEAADWGYKNKLERNEVKIVAEKAFSQLVKNQQYFEALSLFERFELNKERVFEDAVDAFNKCFKKREYLLSARLGKKFDLSEKRTMTALALEIINCINDNKIEKIIKIEKEYQIFNDKDFSIIDVTSRELLVEDFIKIIINKNFQDGKENVVISILENLQLLEKRITFEPLLNLLNSIYSSAANFHNLYLKQNMASKAQILIDFFDLLGEEIPYDIKLRVIDGAINFHNLMLKEFNYDGAKKIKDNYKLLTDNITESSAERMTKYIYEFIWNLFITSDFKLIPEISKEYFLPLDKLKELAKKALLLMLEKRKHIEAGNILNKFHLDPKEEEIEEKAQFVFENLQKTGKHEEAAEIGYFFKLDKAIVEKSILKAWKIKIKKEDFNSAFEMFRKYRFAQRNILKVAKKVYAEFVNSNNVDGAKRLRTDYKLKVDFFDWLKEIIKSILIPSKTDDE